VHLLHRFTGHGPVHHRGGRKPGGTQKTTGGHRGGVPLPSDQTDKGRRGEELQQVRGGDQDGRGNKSEKRTLRKTTKTGEIK
jgi:hypothetical protein